MGKIVELGFEVLGSFGLFYVFEIVEMGEKLEDLKFFKKRRRDVELLFLIEVEILKVLMYKFLNMGLYF